MTDKPKKIGVIRNPDGTFMPGVVTNPNGRPKDTLSVVSAIKKKLKECPDGGDKTYLDLLITRIFKSAIDQGDVQMIKDIINRIDGMPKGSAPSLDFNQINFNVKLTDKTDQIEPIEVKELNDTNN